MVRAREQPDASALVASAVRASHGVHPCHFFVATCPVVPLPDDLDVPAHWRARRNEANPISNKKTRFPESIRRFRSFARKKSCKSKAIRLACPPVNCVGCLAFILPLSASAVIVPRPQTRQGQIPRPGIAFAVPKRGSLPRAEVTADQTQFCREWSFECDVRLRGISCP